MKKLGTAFILSIIVTTTIVVLLTTSIAFAKSLYVIANINASPTPIHTYDIQSAPNYVVFQAEQTITFRGGGGVGIAVDSDSAKLFVTYEVSNVIQLLDATTFADLGTTTAPGATNLSGIVVDQGKSRVYTIDRNTNNLYVYDWDASTNTLTLVTGGAGPGGSFELADVSFAYGIAFDEINDRLFVADQSSNTVRYFETTNFTESGNIVLMTHSPIGIAVDQVRNFLYTGAIFNGDVNLVKYDLNTNTETSVDINSTIDGSSTDGVIGVAVDEDTGNVYTTTGFSFDGLVVFDSSLNNLLTLSRGDIIAFDTSWGDATGLAIPRADISFNPLNFTKTVDLINVSTGTDLTYDLCYDNSVNTVSVNNVSITDNVPTGASFVSASNGGVETSGTVSWDIGTLAAGASQSCVQMVVNVTAPAGSTITNTATIDSDDTPPTTKTVFTNVVVLPELGLSAVANLSIVPSGEDLTYDICYDNIENDFVANNVILTDTVPTGTSFVSASAGGTETSGVVSWELGSLVADAQQACVQMVVTVNASLDSVISNTATIDSDQTVPVTATTSTNVGAPLVVEVDYKFEGKGGGTATGPVELFLLMTGSLILLVRRKLANVHKKSVIGLVILCISLLVGTTTAYANNYTYYGLSVGATNATYNSTDLAKALADYSPTDVRLDDTDIGWKIYAGYQFMPNLAVEASYIDLGEVKSEFNATIAPQELQNLLNDAADFHPYMASGFALAGIGSIEIGESTSVFGKVGVFIWDAEGNVREIGSGQKVEFDDSGTDLMFGLGVKYELNKQWSMRAEWEKFNADRNDINFINIGVVYHY